MNLELIILAMGFLVTLISIASVLVAFRSRYKLKLNIREEDKPEKRAGLILLIGPTKGAAPSAINYHSPALRYCWLIGTKESLTTAQQLVKSYQGIIFYWGEPNYLVNPDEIISTYNAVSHVFDVEVPKTGLKYTEIIADITGGLKPMTAGMMLACVNYKCNVQYMKAPRNEDGEVISGAKSEPIKITIVQTKP